MNPLPEKLGEIAKLYAHTKYLILKCEQIDPELRSSVAIIKELRDAFDHVMRYVGDHFGEEPKGVVYQDAQLDKVVGHVFRASYDALDSLSISLKLRLNQAVGNKSHASITTVFPKYYSEHIVKLREIDERVVHSRQRKDVGDYTRDHLEGYLKFLGELESICAEAEARVTEMVRFDEDQNKKSVWKTIKWILGFVLTFGLGILSTLLLSEWIGK